MVAFLDDLRDWPFAVKLIAQILAALLAVGSGLYVQVYRLPYLGPVDVGWLGVPATLAWILFATNAMNFIDGMNGLAAGVGLVACAFLAFLAEQAGGWFVYAAALLLGAGLVGFLPFNYPRARIFMGDVGSQFVGFVLAVLGVAASRFEGVPISFLLVPLLLSPVLFDVAFTLLRRALAGERLTAPHRGHLYQVAAPGRDAADAGCGTLLGDDRLGRRRLPAVRGGAVLAQASRGTSAAAGARPVDALRRSARPPRRARPLVRASPARGAELPLRQPFAALRAEPSLPPCARLGVAVAASDMMVRRSRRNAAPFSVRCTSTLRRSIGSILRRARSSSPRRSSARVIAGLETLRSAASPRTVCAPSWR